MTEFLEKTADKFTFRVATDRLYSADGLWVASLGGQRVRVGVGDFLQQHSGDVAFVTIRPIGRELAAGADLAELETIKVNLALPSPVGGTVAAVNPGLERSPELVNQAPWDGGWIAELEVADWDGQRAALLSPQAYFEVMTRQVEQELRNP